MQMRFPVGGKKLEETPDPKEARAFRTRWEMVNAAERVELRTTPLDRKLRQLAALMASVQSLGWTEALADEEAEVRAAGIACERPSMAKHEESLVPLLAALRDLVAWLQDAPNSGTVIGGVAASLLGRPRVTRDIDALVLLDESVWEAFLAEGTEFGFVPRLADALSFAHQARVLGAP